MIYICSPFTSEIKSIEKLRYEKAELYSVHLLNQGRVPFSPIVYCYPTHLRYQLDGSFAFWKSFNEGMMERADELHVLMLPGWKESKGVQYEIEWWDARYSQRHARHALRYIEGTQPWEETTNIG